MSGEEAVVDTHQHLWDLDRVRPPWLAGAPEALRTRATTAEYRAATAGLGVARAVYMEVDVAPEDQVAEAEAVLELIRAGDSPTVAAVVGGRPASSGFGEYLDRFKGMPEVKGVRQVLHGAGNPRGECLGAEFVKGVRLLGKRGLSFDLCLRPEELEDGAELAERCPETRFIVDHCGNADPKAFGRAVRNPSHDPEAWKRAMERLSRRPNVVCKVSGIVARAAAGWGPGDLAPIVDHCLDTFGPDRVMFGGDWPVCLTGATFAEWLGALRETVARRPVVERRKLFEGNALKFYGL
jgi:predicted TIM-barrel fold metal-dependent hydrolase